MEPKTCPKCGKAMNIHEHIMGLPGYINQVPGVPIRSGDRISTQQGLPIRVYQCDGCRFLELYAD